MQVSRRTHGRYRYGLNDDVLPFTSVFHRQSRDRIFVRFSLPRLGKQSFVENHFTVCLQLILGELSLHAIPRVPRSVVERQQNIVTSIKRRWCPGKTRMQGCNTAVSWDFHRSHSEGNSSFIFNTFTNPACCVSETSLAFIDDTVVLESLNGSSGSN
jgi:hypothetical protein